MTLSWATKSGHLSTDGRNFTVEEQLERTLKDIRSGEKRPGKCVLLMRQSDDGEAWHTSAGASPDDIVDMLWQALYGMLTR